MNLRGVRWSGALIAAALLSGAGLLPAAAAGRGPVLLTALQSPFTIGAGAYPSVAATPAGGVVVSARTAAGFSGGFNQLVVCGVRFGLRRCASQATLTSPIGTGALQNGHPAVWVSGNTVRVATAGDSLAGDPGASIRVVQWTSTNGGTSFGPAQDLGLTSTNFGGLAFSQDGAKLYTWTNFCGCGARINALPTDGSAVGVITEGTVVSAADQLGTIEGGVLSLKDGGLLLTAANFSSQVNVFHLPPGADPLNAASWSLVLTAAGEELQTSGGNGLVGGQGSASGAVFVTSLNVASGAVVARRWTGAGFGPAVSLPRGRGDVNAAVDGAGRAHVFSSPAAGSAIVVQRAGAAKFGPIATVVTAKGGQNVTESVASLLGTGGGWLAFQEQIPQTIKVVQLLVPHSISGPKVAHSKARHRSVISGKVSTGAPGLVVRLLTVTGSGKPGKQVASARLSKTLAFSFTVAPATATRYEVLVPLRSFYGATASVSVLAPAH